MEPGEAKTAFIISEVTTLCGTSISRIVVLSFAKLSIEGEEFDELFVGQMLPEKDVIMWNNGSFWYRVFIVGSRLRFSLEARCFSFELV